MIFNKHLLFYLAIIFFSMSKTTFSDQKFEGLVASVDSEAITTYDLSERIKLVLKSLKLEDNIKNRDSVRDRVLELLIIEKLKKIEANKAEIITSEQEVIEFAAIVYNFPLEDFENFKEFLSDEDIDFEIVLEQLKNELLWKKLSQQMFASKITINSVDIDAIINNYQNKIGKTEYDFSEIVFLNNNADDWTTSKKKMDTVLSLLNEGTSFTLLANKFSDINPQGDGNVKQSWVLEDNLDAETRFILESMNIGDIKKNIKINNGFKIIKLNKKRKFGKEDSKLSFLKFSSLEKNNIEILKSSKPSCDIVNSENFGKDVKFLKIEDIASKDLSDIFNKQIEKTAEDSFTEIFDLEQEYNILFICKKDETQIKPISRDVVERKAFSNKFNQLSNTFLSNMRKSANIKFFNK